MNDLRSRPRFFSSSLPAGFATLALGLGISLVPALGCREGGADLAAAPGSVSPVPGAGALGAAGLATTRAAAVMPPGAAPGAPPAATRMAMPAPEPPPPPAAPPGVPPKGPDPRAGKFTLADALKGLGGKTDGKLTATLETTMGTFHCDLWDKLAPNTVANFVGLARGVREWADPATGAWVKRPFFDGLGFHRVIPGFMIQGGDPFTAGWLDGKAGFANPGTGNPGYKFDDEIHAENHFAGAGFLAMANAGVRDGHGTNGSQFFVTINPDLTRLDAKHTIFGKCAELDLATAIAGVPRYTLGPYRDRPITPVGIKKVTITRD
ncbi:MAG TPA: peptidylprolyl isomerase [Myxococcota bacterium]|nr:peptidylprolyl isomerase [Myxococcota bacterium]